jgi:PelA/Pel-15E family pectate lyase
MTLAAAILLATSAQAQTTAPVRNPMDSIAKLPNYRAAHDTIPMLSDARIDSLPPRERDPWKAYVTRSRAQRAIDSAAMAAELASVGKKEMERAPYSSAFEVTKMMRPAWFATDSARRIAENILTFQSTNGGWSKHVDFANPRHPGQSYFSESSQWQWISTIDNSSTTEEMRFLALEDVAHPDPRYGTAFRRGVDYLLAAQMPNGCWPQVWPLAGSYHDAATFNDDAITHALEMLRDVADGKYSYPTSAQRSRAKQAVNGGIDCVVKAQYRDHGRLTVWGQQHDPLTLSPTSARSYELTSLTAQESANLLRFLMSQRYPSPEVVTSVNAAAEWLKANAEYGHTYDFATGLHDSAGAGPIWARMYEIGTNRPIFSDRNGIKLYDWNQLNDRRHGYGWYTYAPASALKQYEKWSRARMVIGGATKPKKGSLK